MAFANRIVVIVTLGTVLEWAEFTFFAYMADILSTLFFSIDDSNIARLKTYGIFACSYFMRPLGATVFGIIGDKYGRRPALIYSMGLMCFSTLIIGCLPTYSTIGAAATYALILCRLLQGFAVAGEFNGAAIYIIEHTTTKPYLMGSFVAFGATLGMTCGALASTLVSLPNAPYWAWRIPFLLSGFLGLVILYLRHSLNETPIFKNLIHTKQYSSFSTIFKQNFSSFWIVIVIAFSITVNVYIGNIYYKTIVVNIGHLSTLFASKVVLLGQFLATIFILLFGLVADKFNGKKMCIVGLACAVFLSPIIIAFGQSGNLTLTYLGQIIYSFVNALISAPMMTLVTLNFRPEIRYTGCSLGWSISVALFGGTSLIISELFVTRLGWNNGPGFYMSIPSVIAICTLMNNYIILFYSKIIIHLHNSLKLGRDFFKCMLP